MSTMFSRTKTIGVLFLAALFLPTGCASKLPVYAWSGPDSALLTMSLKSADITTLACDCVIQLGNSEGETIVLDGVLYSRAPDELRMAGWKFSERVFDLLVAGGRSWIYLSSKVGDHAGLDNGPGSIDADDFASMWGYATGNIDQGRVVSIDDDGGPSFEVSMEADGEGVLLLYRIDKATLTVQEISIATDGEVSYRLRLGGYEVISDMVWPTRFSGAGKDGSFKVWMSDVELNSSLPKSTFKRSARMRMQSE